MVAFGNKEPGPSRPFVGAPDQGVDAVAGRRDVTGVPGIPGEAFQACSGQG